MVQSWNKTKIPNLTTKINRHRCWLRLLGAHRLYKEIHGYVKVGPLRPNSKKSSKPQKTWVLWDFGWVSQRATSIFTLAGKWTREKYTESPLLSYASLDRIPRAYQQIDQTRPQGQQSRPSTWVEPRTSRSDGLAYSIRVRPYRFHTNGAVYTTVVHTVNGCPFLTIYVGNLGIRCLTDCSSRSTLCRST